MDKARQKELKLAYKQTFPTMGLFAIRNLASGRLLIDKSTNLPGSLNRHRMELRMGTHRCRKLQEDWFHYGEAAFGFEILERIKERIEPDFNYLVELERILAERLSQSEKAEENFYSVR